MTVRTSCGWCGGWLWVLVLLGCSHRAEGEPASPAAPLDASSAAPLEADPVTLLNDGVSLMEQYIYADAYKVFDRLARAYPGWVAAAVNKGYAALNLQNEMLAVAEQEFTRALRLDPRCIHALVGRGILHSHRAQTDAMLADFEAAAKLDPEDPFILFQKSVALLGKDRVAEARAGLEKAVELQPSLASAYWRLREVYLKLDRSKMAGALKEFSRLQETELVQTVDVKYGQCGRYSLVLRDSAPPGWKGTPPTWHAPALPILGAPVAVAPGPLVLRQRPDGKTMTPAFAVGDLDGDAALEVVICGQGGGEGKPTTVGIYRQGAAAGAQAGWSEMDRLPEEAILCALGDIDGDSDPDLVLAREGTLSAYANDGKGKLTGLPLGEGLATAGFPVRLYCLDLDGDWDLDIACLRQEKLAGGKVVSRIDMINNNRNGTFRNIARDCGTELLDFPAAELILTHLDPHVDADLDLVVLDGASGAPTVFVNDVLWRYRRLDPIAASPRLPGLESTVGADVDGDGDQDLYVLGGAALRLWRNVGGYRFEEDAGFTQRCGAIGGSAAAAFDFLSSLESSLLVVDGRLAGKVAPAFIAGAAAPAPEPVTLAGVAAELEPRSALVTCLGPRQPPSLVLAQGPAGLAAYPLPAGERWMVFDLQGPSKPVSKMERANVGGVGALVEVRAGTRRRTIELVSGAGGTARAPTRGTVGLAGANGADYVRIVWPDSVLQSERGLAALELHRIQEKERKPSSCPILFAWTGERFDFVADFLGVGGLGYLEAKNAYSKPDPTEYVLLPPLEPRDGNYVLQVLEPLEECTYLDELQLTVVDHPADVSVLPEEMFAVRGPAPGFRLLAFREPAFPEAAADAAGGDVTAAIAAVDRVYAGELRRDPRFPGLARESHWIELDFGARLERLLAKGGAGSRPYLFLHGFVEYGYSTSNFAAWQANAAFRAPTVSVERGGRWVPLREEWGFPAGYPRYMSVDLTGLLARGDRRLRIETNMEIRWDQAFLADVASASVTARDLSLDRAELAHVGFPAEESPDGSVPPVYVWSGFRKESPYRPFPGAFTRHGDVRELLAAADDRHAILGPGDGLTLEVRRDRLPPLAPGMRRTFLAKTVGYCKDMDPYTAHPQGVEPLPFQAMSGYPYRPDESFPRTPGTEAYLREWNTRVVPAPAAPGD